MGVQPRLMAMSERDGRVRLSQLRQSLLEILALHRLEEDLVYPLVMTNIAIEHDNMTIDI